MLNMHFMQYVVPLKIGHNDAAIEVSVLIDW